ncbi:MAG: hypothetical protein NZM43_10120 [Saprospiraceae bacterium]|nr:hypothetical protein [Saprospiraceae bacterium]MDW8484670.1 hypothetical protein [Saprospiraceae bacterium]
MKVAFFAGPLLLLSAFLWRNTQPENEESSIVIQKTADNHLVALIQNNPSYPNAAFILQTTADLSEFRRIELVNGRIQEGEKCVEFQSADNRQKIVFKLSSSPCPIASTDARVFGGYGLIRQQDEKKHSLLLQSSESVLPPVKEILLCACVKANDAPLSGCSSGGVGANECAYEVTKVGPGIQGSSPSKKCSVKCEGSDRYACCY